MITGEKKARRKINIIRHISILLVMIFLAAYTSYAWIKREWTPYIKSDENGIYIATGSSLAFIFDELGTSTGTEINKLLKVDDFVFKSVSNFSGKSEDFFSLEYSPAGVGYETYHNVKKDEMPNVSESMIWTELGKEYGYIELQFKIVAPESDDKKPRYIYIDESSYIEDADTSDNIDPTKSLRISISMITKSDNTFKQETVMFCADSRGAETVHRAVTDEVIEGVIPVADGQYRCQMDANGKVIMEGDQPVEQKTVTIDNKIYDLIKTDKKLNLLSEKNGNSPEECLFAMDEVKEQIITVRIWIEGVDEYCVDEIAGKSIKLLLKFSSKKFTTSQETE